MRWLRPARAALLLIAMNVAPEHENEFNEWYNIEHLPALGAVPGVLAARRYRGSGATQRYAAIYHFANPDVPNSAAWKNRREHAVDRAHAAAFPRFPQARLPAVCGAIARRNLSQRTLWTREVREDIP